MKNQISALEIHYLIQEMQALLNGKVDKIYHPCKKELLIQLHVPNVGKRIIRLVVPSLFYITAKKSIAREPTGFCMYLRKYLNNNRLRSIRQINSERIIEFEFEGNQGIKRFIFEFFLKGNMVLCDGDLNILSVEQNQVWADRELKPKCIYSHPESPYNFFKLSKLEMADLLRNSLQKSLVKAMAVDLGLGGVYAEEICIIAKEDKTDNPKKSNSEALYKGLQKILSKKIKAIVVTENDHVNDVVPFLLSKYKAYNNEIIGGFNEALDKSVPREVLTKSTKNQGEIIKVEKIIFEQEKTVDGLTKKNLQSTKIAELIYEKYEYVESVLSQVKKGASKLSSNVIKEKIKGHKVIKEFNARDKYVIIEL